MDWTIDKIPTQIRERVFLLGNVKNIYPLYRTAEALLFTSHAEGYPNVLVEAVVSGTPIIGFEAGDSKLILDAYDLGYSVDTQLNLSINLVLYSTTLFPTKKKKEKLLVNKNCLTLQ